MESGAITDAQVTASSEYNNLVAERGRLQDSQAWSAAAGANNVNQWLQIDLGTQYPSVSRVATQGTGRNWDEWVKKYKLEYGNDGVNFQYYIEQGQAAAKVKSTFSSKTYINLRFWSFA